MPNEGKLTVRANKKKGKIIISVKDTGFGIPEENKTNFHAAFPTKSKGQGLGFVKRLVEALNNEITPEGQQNK